MYRSCRSRKRRNKRLTNIGRTENGGLIKSSEGDGSAISLFVSLAKRGTMSILLETERLLLRPPRAADIAAARAADQRFRRRRRTSPACLIRIRRMTRCAFIERIEKGLQARQRLRLRDPCARPDAFIGAVPASTRSSATGSSATGSASRIGARATPPKRRGALVRYRLRGTQGRHAQRGLVPRQSGLGACAGQARLRACRRSGDELRLARLSRSTVIGSRLTARPT